MPNKAIEEHFQIHSLQEDCKGLKMENIKELSRQRNKLLKSITQLLEGPMIFLGFVWLILLIVEFTGNTDKRLGFLSSVIWVIFIIDFVFKLILAPDKSSFLKRNWLTAISLLIPAIRFLRVFRLLRILRFFKGTRLIKVVSSLNRSMRSLNGTMQRRGFGYVMILTIAVILAGAAGMFAFENEATALNSYGEAVWWTIMVVITVGTDYWPRSTEGRILCLMLATYGFAVFGYITATLASFFVGRDAEQKDGPVAGASEIELLRNEIRELSQLIKNKNE